MSGLANRPPMGWNSWDCFGGTVTEAEVLENATYLSQGLAAHGWDTVVVDIQWYEPDPSDHGYAATSRAVVDPYGRLLPAENRFPSAAAGGGFAALAARVHDLGLRFGVHLMRGVPKVSVERALPILGTSFTCADIADPDRGCAWNPDNHGVLIDHPAAQAWYDSVAVLLAGWGVDFIKFDDVLSPPIEAAEIELLSRAIDRSGRPMMLSLSPGLELSLTQADFLASHAQLWRVSDDLWDDWVSVAEQFQRAARWAPLQRPGAWGDLDMLPLGRIGIRAHVGEDRASRLNTNEQRTMMTLWSVARSPLFFGGHLPDTPTETLRLLSNRSVLEVHSSALSSREIIRDQDLVVWQAELPDALAVAVFNLGGAPMRRPLHLSEVGASGPATELWSAEPAVIERGALHLHLGPHDAAIYRFGTKENHVHPSSN